MRDVLHQVIKASPIGDSTVAVTFENGICGTYDCAYLMEDPYSVMRYCAASSAVAKVRPSAVPFGAGT